METLVDVLVENLPHPLTADRLEYLARESVERALEAEGKQDLADEVSVLFAGDDYVKDLNSKYLHRDETTDVLAFSMMEASGDEPPAIEVPPVRMLGDVVVSVDTAARQATEYGHSIEREIALLVIHGVLHLLGLDDHEDVDRERMNQAQERALAAVRL